MFEDKVKLTMPILRQVILILVFASGCLFFPGQNLADDSQLSSDHGYMLIRVKLEQRERVGVLVMSDVDKNHVIRIHTKSFEPAGTNAWMALVAMPNGRYFWSEYESIYGIGVEAARDLNRKHKRRAPGSASDTFEIVSGAVNYVGDWEMRVISSQQMRLDPRIGYDKSTLERYVAQYPEYANRYEIYLSIMGKEAISLEELAKISKEQSESR